MSRRKCATSKWIFGTAAQAAACAGFRSFARAVTQEILKNFVGFFLARLFNK